MTAVVGPAAHRPYIDGSQDDSAYQQVFVYNGFGRFGDQTPLQLLAGQSAGATSAVVSPAAAPDRLLRGDLGRDTGWPGRAGHRRVGDREPARPTPRRPAPGVLCPVGHLARAAGRDVLPDHDHQPLLHGGAHPGGGGHTRRRSRRVLASGPARGGGSAWPSSSPGRRATPPASGPWLAGSRRHPVGAAALATALASVTVEAPPCWRRPSRPGSPPCPQRPQWPRPTSCCATRVPSTRRSSRPRGECYLCAVRRRAPAQVALTIPRAAQRPVPARRWPRGSDLGAGLGIHRRQHGWKRCRSRGSPDQPLTPWRSRRPSTRARGIPPGAGLQQRRPPAEVDRRALRKPRAHRRRSCTFTSACPAAPWRDGPREYPAFMDLGLQGSRALITGKPGLCDRRRAGAAEAAVGLVARHADGLAAAAERLARWMRRRPRPTSPTRTR